MSPFDPKLSPQDLSKLHDKPEVMVRDRVRTKTNRIGVVTRLVGDTAYVDWDDGTSFAIRSMHLEVLARNWDIPSGTKPS